MLSPYTVQDVRMNTDVSEVRSEESPGDNFDIAIT